MQDSTSDVRTSSSQAGQHQRPTDEDTASQPRHEQQQQQDEANVDSHSEDSYSEDFSSDSSTDDDGQTQKPQEQERQTHEPSADRPAKNIPRTSAETENRHRQRGRSSTTRTAEKLAGTTSTRLQGFGRSEKSPTRSAARIGSAAKQREQRAGNSEPNDEDGGRTGSPGRPAPRGAANSESPVRDYHLSYTDNDHVRQWLRSKDALSRRERKERKRLERTRRRQVEERQLEELERRKKSDVVVQQWMEQKKIEMRMLNKRQQQQPKTLEHPQQQQAKPVKDEPKNSDPARPGDQCSKKGSGFIPAVDRDGKNTLPVKDDRSKVTLFTRLENIGMFPGEGTRKTPEKKTEVVERCKTYGDWSRKKRTAGLSIKDEAKLNVVKDQSKASSHCVPHPPVHGPATDRRCASAKGGRRRKDVGASPKMPAGRPRSGIGTRLEPQGADRLDQLTEPDSTAAASKSKQNDTSAGLKVTNPETPWKLSPSPVVTNVSSRFDDGKITERNPHVTAGQDGKEMEDQKIIGQGDDTHLRGRDRLLENNKCEERSSSSCDSDSDIQGQGRGVEKTLENQKSTEDHTGVGRRMESRDLIVNSGNENSRPSGCTEQQRSVAGQSETAEDGDRECATDEERSREGDEHRKMNAASRSDAESRNISRSGSADKAADAAVATDDDIVANDNVAIGNVVLPTP